MVISVRVVVAQAAAVAVAVVATLMLAQMVECLVLGLQCQAALI